MKTSGDRKMSASNRKQDKRIGSSVHTVPFQTPNGIEKRQN